MSPKKKLPGYALPLGLAVVLCALGGVAYWLEFAKKPRDEAAEADAKRVFPIRGKSIARFAVRGGALSVSLECADLAEKRAEKLCKPEDHSKWNLVEPVRAQGDDATVNSLLKNFANLTTTETVDLESDAPEKRERLLRDYGVDSAARAKPETRRLAFQVADGPKYVAYFGEKHPIGDGVFALLETAGAADETKVYVVPDWQLSVFGQDTAYFRDKKLFGWNEKEVTAFRIERSRKTDRPIEGTRAEDGKTWTLRIGVQVVEGDLDGIDGMLSGALFLTAKGFAAERKDSPAAKRALAGARLVDDLELRSPKGTKRLRIHEKPGRKPEPSRFFATVDDQDPLFELDAFAVEKLEKAPAELRNAKLIQPVDRYAIRTLEFARIGGAPFRIAAGKDAAGVWTVVESAGAAPKPVVRGRVDALLDRLSAQVVTNFRPGGRTAPMGDRLRLKTEKAEFEFWMREKRLFARALPDGESLELEAGAASLLPWDADAFSVDGAADAAAPRPAAPPAGDGHDHGHDH